MFEAEVLKPISQPNRVIRKRRSRTIRKPNRRIPITEANLMMGIWRWKLLTYPLAKKLFFNDVSEWTYYEKIRRLVQEGYLIEQNGVKLDLCVLQLSKKGFNYIKNDIGHLREQRFAAQSVSHDYQATAFHIGEFAIYPSQDVEFLTEQEIHCTDDSLLPDWINKSRDHVPDVYTRIKNETTDSVIAFEMELNLKPWIYYMKAGHHFENWTSKAETVFWVCDGINLIKRIFQHLSELNLKRMDIHHFVLLEDFKKEGWNAFLRSGRERKKVIRDVYNTMSPQGLPKEGRIDSQTQMLELLFSKRKSPKISEL